MSRYVVVLVGLIVAGAVFVGCRGGRSARTSPRPPRPAPAPPAAHWSYLPETIRDVVVDRRGRPWAELFERGLTVREPQMRASVEAAYRDQALPVVGADVMGLDAKGRIWVRAGNGGAISAYDGSAWMRRAVTDQAVPPDAGGAGAGGAGGAALTAAGRRFRPAMLEDARGNLFFIETLGVHRLMSEGTWDFLDAFEPIFAAGRIAAPPHDPRGGAAFAPIALAMGPGGDVFAWAPWVVGATGTLGVFRFDGERWTVLGRPDGLPSAEIEAFLPLPDGTFYVRPRSAPGVPWRPGDPPVPDPRELVAQLDVADAGEREEALRRLVAAGPRMIATINDALALNPPPPAEVAKRLKNALEELRAIVVPFGGRYAFRDVHRILDRRDGSMLVELVQLRDVLAPEVHQRQSALAHVAWDGTWSIAPFCSPASPGKGGSALTAVEDARGVLWLAEGPDGVARVDPDGTVTDLDPPEFGHAAIAGPDAAGRLYLVNHNEWPPKVLICEMRAPGAAPPTSAPFQTEPPAIAGGPAAPARPAPAATTPPSPTRLVPQSFKVHHRPAVASDGFVWAQVDDKGLCRFRDGAWEPMLDVPAEQTLDLLPLKGGQLLAVRVPERRVDHYDGERWRQWMSMTLLVEERFGELRKLIDNASPQGFYTRLYIDALGDVWVDEWAESRRYDGQEWHDVRAEVRRGRVTGGQYFDFLRPFDGGRYVLASRARGHFVFARTPDAPPRVVEFEAGAKLHGWAGAHQDGQPLEVDGTLWLKSNWPERAWTLRGTRFEEVMDAGEPMVAGSDGTRWFHDSRTPLIRARRGDGVGGVRFDGLGAQLRMTVTPEGRVWVLHGRGLSEVRAEARGDALEVREAGRWERVSPKPPGLRDFFADAAGALWIHHDELHRLEAPPPSEAR